MTWGDISITGSNNCIHKPKYPRMPRFKVPVYFIYKKKKSHQKKGYLFSIHGWRAYINLTHLELAQPINKLKDPQIKIPRARPIALTIGTTVIFPADDMREKVRNMHVL